MTQKLKKARDDLAETYYAHRHKIPLHHDNFLTILELLDSAIEGGGDRRGEPLPDSYEYAQECIDREDELDAIEPTAPVYEGTIHSVGIDAMITAPVGDGLFPDKHGNGGLIQDLCYTIWDKCQYPTHPDGKTDWFNDTQPIVMIGIEKIKAAHQPASVDLKGVRATLECLMQSYEQDITKAIEIMGDLGRVCDPAEIMVEQTKKLTRYNEALADLDKMGV